MPMTEEEIQALVEPISDLFFVLEKRTRDRIAGRLAEIGALSATDIHQLERLGRLGADIETIEKEIATATGIAQDEIHNIILTAAKTDYESQRAVFEQLGLPWVPFEENTELQNLVESIAKTTSEEMLNMTRTTGFVGDISGLKKVPPHWTPLATYYQDTIDFATLQIRTGVTDYHKTIRSTVRLLSDKGLSYIEYDNEGKRYYRRRLDSSVRNAVNGGLQRLSKAQAEITGAKFGADGMEVSAHFGARESHQWFQGQQFPMDVYHKDVAAYLDDYNCYHRAFPILLGLSEPAYSKEELADLREQDARVQYYEGKGYNAYQARQRQRQLETSMRTWKDRAVAFGASGDKAAEQTAIIRASEVNRHYNQFSNAMGLPVKPNLRTTLSFTRSQAARMGAITRQLNATQ